jgi:hypothetical protein
MHSRRTHFSTAAWFFNTASACLEHSGGSKEAAGALPCMYDLCRRRISMQTWYVNWRTTTGEHTGGSKQCQATFVAAKADPHMQIPSLPLWKILKSLQSSLIQNICLSSCREAVVRILTAVECVAVTMVLLQHCYCRRQRLSWILDIIPMCGLWWLQVHASDPEGGGGCAGGLRHIP